MCEPIYKYQYLIDKVLKHLEYKVSKHPNSICILLKNPELIRWNCLSMNPNAIKILEKNLDKLDKFCWYELSQNPNAVPILEKNLDKIDWQALSKNINAIHILENNLDKIDWAALSTNPNAIHILENNLDKIDWFSLCKNPNAINILEKNLDYLDYICWYELSSNPNAVPILEKNLDKVCWQGLSLNINAIHLLESNLDKVDWQRLAQNQNAVSIIENYLNYLEKIEEYDELLSNNHSDIYYSISGNINAIHLIKKIMPAVNYRFLALNENALEILMKYTIDNDNFYDKILPVRAANMTIIESLIENPSLFDLDYIKMSKKRTEIIYNELIEKALSPARISKHLYYHLEQGYNIIDFDYY